MSRILFNIPKERARVSGVKSILLSFLVFLNFSALFYSFLSSVVKSSSQLDAQRRCIHTHKMRHLYLASVLYVFIVPFGAHICRVFAFRASSTASVSSR